MQRLFAHTVGTFFGVGHIPIVPATWTSLAVALVVYFTQLGLTGQLIFLTLALILGVPACTALEKQYGKDPKQATVDEVAGQIITLLGAPLTPLVVGLAFFLFRGFDVLKPPPARRFESLPRGWGVMADDVMAGIYARLTLAVLLWLIPGLRA
jgi:phosphatidylglycerophosphatase A